MSYFDYLTQRHSKITFAKLQSAKDKAKATITCENDIKIIEESQHGHLFYTVTFSRLNSQSKWTVYKVEVQGSLELEERATQREFADILTNRN